MNILSLFDGCACARVALDRAGIPVSNYFASEIDKYAVKIALKNYPDIQQLGDIRTVNPFLLPHIHLVIGGSPCQDLSIAGSMRGLNGERSGLFFDFVRLVCYLKPDWFLLENVNSMKKLDRWIMTQFMGVEPVLIDSALVSAQQRKRLYWTNIPVRQPENKGILLKDVIESGLVDRDKSYCIDANYWKGTTPVHYAKYHLRQMVFETEAALGTFYQIINEIRNEKPHQVGYINQNHRDTRVYDFEGKSVTLASQGGGWGMKTGLYLDSGEVRKLTPVECERLQTLPDNYTEGVSNTQRYRMLGNGFTVDVITHILRGIR